MVTACDLEGSFVAWPTLYVMGLIWNKNLLLDSWAGDRVQLSLVKD